MPFLLNRMTSYKNIIRRLKGVNIIKCIRQHFRKTAANKERNVKTFSEEKLIELKDELKLVNLALGVLRDRANVYAREYSVNAASMAATNLHARRVELSAQIEALNNFLYS